MVLGGFHFFDFLLMVFVNGLFEMVVGFVKYFFTLGFEVWDVFGVSRAFYY